MGISLAAASAIMLQACTNTLSEAIPYTVDEIAPSVFHIQDCNADNPAGESFAEDDTKTHFNNCSDIYLLNGEEKALLIDLSNKIEWAPNAEEALRSIVYERIGDKDLIITFTHNHGDHTGMLPAFKKEERVSFMLPSVDFADQVKKFPADSYCLYEEGYEFDLGGMKVATVMVPGHTPGSMVFLLEGSDILFAGDAIGSGHGVWIFNQDAFAQYIQGVKHLREFLTDESNGINLDSLKIYGGHYWQKDWFPELGDDVFGWQYFLDMEALVDKVLDGTAATEPSNLNFGALDTYFRNGQAIIAGNNAFGK